MTAHAGGRDLSAGRPLDIPPCDHPTWKCPPVTERTAMTTNDLAEAERRIIHQTREQAIAEIGADRYNQLITVFVEAHKNDPGTIGNPLVIDEPTCGAEYRPGHRDGWCSFPPGHPPIPRSGTYYQHANPDTGWWWNTLPAARCGKPDTHEPHVTDLGRWCDGHPAS